MRSVAEHHRQGALAGDRVGRDVAQVVDHQDRAGQRADADRGVQRRPARPRLGLDVRRADHRDQPEEHEDHHLAEAEVAVGPRAAGVEPRGEHADRARPRPATRRWWRPAPGRPRAATPNARNAARLHRARGRGPGADEPHRADPVGVGAADAVGVVVGVVDRHLQRQADHQGEQRLPPDRARRRTPRRRCRPARGRPPRAGCADGRRRATGRGLPRAGIQAGSARHRSRGPARARRAAGPGRGGWSRRAFNQRCEDRRMDILRPVGGGTREVVAALAAWLAAPDEPRPLVVETSGSTGRPSGWCCPARAVLASVRGHRAPAGRRPGRWLLALPASYVAGVQVVCRSLVAGHDAGAAGGARVVRRRPPRPGAPAVRLAGADPAAPDARRRPRTWPRCARFHTVLLGGGPIDPALRARAADGGVRVVATYGSAETAGGCVYDGVPLDGVGLAHRAGRAAPDRRTDAVRRLRRRPGADRARCWSTAGS